MSEKTPASYDDIDLFDLLETLWAGKSVILATAVMPVVITFGISHTLTPTFEVRAPYFIKIAPIYGEDTVATRIESLTHGEWVSVDGGSPLLLTTESLGPVVDYQNKLAEINQSLAANMLSEAEDVSEMIEQQFSSELRSTEVVARKLLGAKQVILQLENNGTPLAFGTISTSKSNRNPLLLNVAVALCGAFLGVLFVLFKKAFRDRNIAKDRIEC